MATGVLPLLIGKATRLAQFFERGHKVYEGTIRFGHSTHTYDADGTPTSEEKPVSLDCSAIRDQLPAFRGKIMQMPPPVSAKKISGTPGV
jgi:tRNA pseudouridine55 synthase